MLQLLLFLDYLDIWSTHLFCLFTFFFFVTNWLLLLAWRMHIGKCVLIEYRTIEI